MHYNNVTVMSDAGGGDTNNANSTARRLHPHNSTFHHNNVQQQQLRRQQQQGQHTGSTNNMSTMSKKLNTSALVPANVSRFMLLSKEAGVKEMILSLGLLCLVSLLLALLALVSLLKISPADAATVSRMRDVLSEDELTVVYSVTLAMCALTLSLNLCCLLVCAIQFLFAVRLVRSPQGKTR